MRVISVRHTGTNFLCSLLRCQYTHTDQHPEQLPGIEDMLLVSPLRDPHKVWESWAKRRDNKNVEEQYANAISLFMLNWQRLAEFDKKFSVIYVPIDRPERDAQMEKLTFKGAPNWDKKVGNAIIPDEECTQRLALYPWHPAFNSLYDLPMVKKYYGSSSST